MPDDSLALIVPNADGLLQSRPDNGPKWQINWLLVQLAVASSANLLIASGLNYLQRNLRRTIREHLRIDRYEQRRLFDVSRRSEKEECDR